jgi:hypothetical protein
MSRKWWSRTRQSCELVRTTSKGSGSYRTTSLTHSLPPFFLAAYGWLIASWHPEWGGFYRGGGHEIYGREVSMPGPWVVDAFTQGGRRKEHLTIAEIMILLEMLCDDGTGYWRA